MAQYFDLTLGTLAPSNGVLSGLNNYYNNDAVVTISADGASFMKVWTNDTAIGTINDTQIPENWEAYNTSKTVSFSKQGEQYVHAMFMDDVGNIGPIVNSAATFYDTMAPVITSSVINDGSGYTKTLSNVIRVSFSDFKGSGVNRIDISLGGPSSTTSYSVSDEERAAGYKDISFVLPEGDGTKNLSLFAFDRAGNESGFPVINTIILDTSPAIITAILRKSDDSENLAAYVNTREYGVRIITEATDISEYQIWEDNFDSSWSPINTATVIPGVGYFINNLRLSTGDGEKIIHVRVRDAAGNETINSGTLSVMYDTSSPAIDVNSPDYNRISKTHTSRLDALGFPITGKYNDVCIFSWSANKNLAAFKVCVNEPNQTAAEATPIGTTYGSQNMVGGSVLANTDITSTIFGADFAATNTVNDTDGVYEVIIYGQDESGNWSDIHVITQ